ncbi:uncharacterized protein si:dkey-111e8.4 [Hoplias malabaricus]|uniref:uncharacterized protein si:dkey-111e8.4 n=1 Tax=Hoplias malabaricus TaxID=27720 RepID=UPI003461E566
MDAGVDGSRMSSMSQWLNSDVFIVFVVVLLLLVVAAIGVCCVTRYRRTHTTTERMAEIEILPCDGSDRSGQVRVILKIVTEQKHASELIHMLTGHRRLTEADQLATEVASTSIDQPLSHTLSNRVSHHTQASDQQVSQLDFPTDSETAATGTHSTDSEGTEEEGVKNKDNNAAAEDGGGPVQCQVN